MTAEKVIIAVLNGGFSDKYHDDKNIMISYTIDIVTFNGDK